MRHVGFVVAGALSLWCVSLLGGHASLGSAHTRVEVFDIGATSTVAARTAEAAVTAAVASNPPATPGAATAVSVSPPAGVVTAPTPNTAPSTQTAAAGTAVAGVTAAVATDAEGTPTTGPTGTVTTATPGAATAAPAILPNTGRADAMSVPIAGYAAALFALLLGCALWMFTPRHMRARRR